MQTLLLRRRACLLLPLAFAACGGQPPQSYQTLRYNYLPPIRLNVAQVDVQSDYVPSGMSWDVTPEDPVQPADALRQMAQDRLKPFGPPGHAVLVIEEASMVQQGDTINGTFAVRLDIYTSANNRTGYAEARVAREHVGDAGDLPRTLFDMTKQMMDAMNVELEYQIRHSLADWLVPGNGTAPPSAVQQQPLGPSVQQEPLTPPPNTPPSAPPNMPPPSAPPPSAPPPSAPPPAPAPSLLPGSVPPPIPLHP
jgi:hypothetical protein